MSDPSEFSTGICLNPLEIDDYDSSVSPFTIFLIIIVIIDLIALSIMIIFVWRETNAKKSYQMAKRKAVKLVLSPDYLAKLRPPKRPPPPLALVATPDELMSKKVSKKSEKGPPKNDGNDENIPLAASYTAKESSEATGKELDQLAPSYTAMDQVEGEDAKEK
ncbi:hypothetical protein M3Y96_00211100 [Aphelenchoides besseyi]|nr:hypothetical protein M3Y96_00211100 [Aphelenchoides besseyi]